MAYEIERNRALYAYADTGIAMLPPRSARCVGTARVLYAQILDRIEAAEMNVWTRRVRVPTVRKAVTAAADHDRRAAATAHQDDTTEGAATKCHFGLALARPTHLEPTAVPLSEQIRARIPISRVPQPREDRMTSTWRLAHPVRIAAALAASQEQNSGGWYVAGVEWRRRHGRLDRPDRRGPRGHASGGRPTAPSSPVRAPARTWVRCWTTARCSATRCTAAGTAWRSTPEGDRTWSPYRAYDDGVLIWVGLPTDGESPTDRPSLPLRPPLSESVTAVIHWPGTCEPQDVIANRLDPWHGSWFHPYAFSHLVVDDTASDERRLVVDVTFRLNRTWGVPVTRGVHLP